jgi:hypothetical protein
VLFQLQELMRVERVAGQSASLKWVLEAFDVGQVLHADVHLPHLLV